jgi:hypothetical protein
MDADDAHRLHEPAERVMENCPCPRPASPSSPHLPLLQDHADQPFDRSPKGPYVGPLFVGAVMLWLQFGTRKHCFT